MYPVCTRPLTCMLLGFEAMHLPPNVALFALEDNQSSAKALILEPTLFSLSRSLSLVVSGGRGALGLGLGADRGTSRLHGGYLHSTSQTRSRLSCSMSRSRASKRAPRTRA